MHLLSRRSLRPHRGARIITQCYTPLIERITKEFIAERTKNVEFQAELAAEREVREKLVKLVESMNCWCGSGAIRVVTCFRCVALAEAEKL